MKRQTKKTHEVHELSKTDTKRGYALNSYEMIPGALWVRLGLMGITLHAPE